MSARQDRGLAELSDRWLLPYQGMRISQITVDYALTFLLEGRPQSSSRATQLWPTGPAAHQAPRPSSCTLADKTPPPP